MPNVLIVDQNLDRRFQVKQLVSEAQFEVCGEVGYGAAATSLAADVKPDVILCAMEKLLGRSAQTVETLISILPETPIVVYSPDGDLEVARQAMRTGARDFLALPTSADQLRQAITSALEAEGRRRLRVSGDAPPTPQGAIMTVFGPKGGIGKTTVVTNLGVALALSGQSVVIADADAGFGDVAGMLDIQPERTIVDLSEHIAKVKRETLARFLLPHQSGLMLLAAPPMALDWRKVSPDSFRQIIDSLARAFDVVVIDTSGMLDELTLIALEASSLVLWLTTTEYSSIKDSQAALRALRQFNFRQDRIRLLVNEISPVNDVRPAAVAETLGLPIFWRIPYDGQLRRSAQLGKPVMETAPGSKIAQNFRDLAGRISGVSPEPSASTVSRFRFGRKKASSVDESVIAPTLEGEKT
jgi:pilus assembly protein CpaE